MVNKQLDTPCVGICSTVYGDDVCRGCKRFSPEIIEWNSYDSIQKQSVFDRLGVMIHNIVADKLTVFDPILLREQLDFLGIRYRYDQSAYCDLYYLLRAGASQIKQSTDFGFQPLSKYSQSNMVELFNDIEHEYLTRAQLEFKLRPSTSEEQ